MSKKIFGPFSQLLTMSNLPESGAIKDDQLEVLSNAGVLVNENMIEQVGDFDQLLHNHPNEDVIELQKGITGLPGFIDCHTHICFAGNRAQDYALRNAGHTYLEIAEKGGGIWDTVKATREATLWELASSTAARANQLLRRGVTTIEVKSGYGLSVQEELKMLRAIQRANVSTKADLIPTCLAAHVKPHDFSGSPQEYLQIMESELFPVLRSEELANRVDAFAEEGAFTLEELLPYFSKASEMGFDLTIHADQFHTGGSDLAVRFGALSADHLEASGAKEVEALASSDVVAVALPGASVGLGCDFAPARTLLNKGGSLAIASDWNPGSAPMGDLLTQAAILGAFQKLTNAEVLAGITVRAAKALNLHDRGALLPGKKADVALFTTSDYRDILYHQGQMKPAQTIKNGNLLRL